MKVYIITNGDYSSYQICAVTLDEAQAELLKARYSGFDEEANIEVFDTDNHKIEVGEDYKPLWNVEFRGSEICRCYAVEHENINHGKVYEDTWSNKIKVFVKAKDEAHAKRIAIDTYMKWLAEQNGL